MLVRKTLNSAVLILLCSLIIQPCVYAQPGDSGPQAPGQQEQDTRISRKEASDIARRDYGGRVVSIRLENGEWRIRVDNEGTVFDVYVNASTGRARRS